MSKATHKPEATEAEAAYQAARHEAASRGASPTYFHLLRVAARAKHVKAMCDLGMWHLDRDYPAGKIALRRSSRVAFGLLSAAAEAGNGLAMLSLATCYEHGIGAPRDPRAEEHWLRAAARAGEYFGASNVATLCRDRGERRNERRWLKRAAAMGDRTACLTLAEIARRKSNEVLKSKSLAEEAT